MLREVQVRPAFANLYPALSPDRWYTAAAVVGLLKGMRINHDGPTVQFPERLLAPDHFIFRGGSKRQGGWLGLRTRRQDRKAEGAQRRHAPVTV